MEPILLGTANPGKARELERLLGAAGIAVERLPTTTAREPVDEPNDSPAENARAKAVVYARRVGRWVLADDTALEVDALFGGPGVHTARFAGPGADAAANRRKLLEQLAGVPLQRRGARFVCYLALSDPRGELRAESAGQCRGRILPAERGAGGFGYDALFELVEYHRTLAELGETAKCRLSHRGRAVERMLPVLRALRDGSES